MSEPHGSSTECASKNDHLARITSEPSSVIATNQLNGDFAHKPHSRLKTGGHSDKMIVISDSDVISEVVVGDVNGINDNDHEDHRKDHHHQALTNGDLCAESSSSPPSTFDYHHNNSNHASPNHLSNFHSNADTKPLNSSLNPNPKKYGKFRILATSSDQLNSLQSTAAAHDEGGGGDQTIFEANHLSVCASNGFSSLHANCDLDISSQVDISSTVTETNIIAAAPVKRRGRPKKNASTKTDSTRKESQNTEETQPVLSSNENRRRSTRLRKLEEKKDEKPSCSHLEALQAAPLDHHLNTNSASLSDKSTTVHEIKIEEGTSNNAEVPTAPALAIASGETEGELETKPSKSRTKTNENSKRDKRKTPKSKRKEKSSKSSKKNKDRSVSNKNESQLANFPTPLPLSTNTHVKVETVSPSKSDWDEDGSSVKPEKVKSRWRRNSELDYTTTVDLPSNANSTQSNAWMEQPTTTDNRVLQNCTNEVCNESIPHFEALDESIFLFERKKSKSKKETKKMVCDCILTKEERARGIMGCGDDCLNRMLMIECGSRCPLGDHCSNKRFSKKQNAKVEPFKTHKKGWGLRALESVPPYTFIMEYVGEVIDPFDFHKRVEKYAKQKLEHHYFMALKADEIIDATCRGNVTRFINHSCEPNSQTQKWTVNGELRIGFFTFKQVNVGEEITFDYQFQRYGKKAQKCYCGAESCRGYIGGENANILTDGSKIPKKVSKKYAEEDDEEVMVEEEELESDEEEFLEDIGLEEEINALDDQRGLRNRQQMLEVSRLMLRAEKVHLKAKLINVIRSTVENAYLRLFIDYHGLGIIWGWMVEADDVELKARLLGLLEILPIHNKTMLTDSKVYFIVERWAQKDSPESLQFVNIATSEDPNSKETEKRGDKSPPAPLPPLPLLPPPPATSISDNSTTEADGIKVEDVDELSTDKDNAPSDSSNEKMETEPAVASSEVKAEAEKKPYELIKLSGKAVIKSRSKVNSESVVSASKKSNVTIGFLAQKLLTHWKDLKEVFRIPRLERQNRHKDEEEADRRAKEVEDRQAQGLPSTSSFAQKRIDEDYTIAGILGGNKRRCLKSLTEASREPTIKRNNNSNIVSPQFYINPGNSNQNSTGNKMTKEEHRKMFEYQLARNDYVQVMKKYHEDYARYQESLQQQQIMQMQVLQQLDPNDPQMTPKLANSELVSGPSTSANTNTNTNINTNPAFPNLFTMTEQPGQLVPSLTPAISDQTYSSNIFLSEPAIRSTEQSTNLFESDNAYLEQPTLKDIVPNFGSPLIVLSNCEPQLDSQSSAQDMNNLSSFAIDNVDYDQVRYYSDDLIESMEKKMFDEIYPPSGVFYITKSGSTYFMALPSDLSQAINVKENVTEPLPLSFTKRNLNEVMLPYSWSFADLQGHAYYFNKRKQIKQWHPPQDSQIDSYDDNHRIDLFDVANELNFASNSSSPLRNRRDRDSLDAEELGELKRKNTKQLQDNFRTQVSRFVVKCLNPYMRIDCRKSRITSNDDFKFLARKLTHNVVAKEIKQSKHMEDLACTESVKLKTKEYVRKYMSKYGSVYRADSLGAAEKSNSP